MRHARWRAVCAAWMAGAAVCAASANGYGELPCGGIGVLLAGTDPTTIVRVSPDSPAEKAGIKVGDVLVRIDGSPVEGKSMREITRAIRGDPMTTVTVTIRKIADQSESDLALTRVPMETVHGFHDGLGEDAEPEPAPIVLPTNTLAALQVIAVELQKLNARIARLENPDGSSWSGRRSGANMARLSEITLPDPPTREDVRTYIARIQDASQGQNTFSEMDPQVRMLVKVGEENMDLLLEAAASGMSSFHMRYAIQRLATDKSKALILAALPENRELAAVVLRRGWQKDARATLMAGLGADYLPTEWIQAIASFKDPATYEPLLQHFVDGQNRSWTYESIKDLPGIELDTSVARAWELARYDDVWERSRMAAIAVAYGHESALDALVQLLRTTSSRNTEYMLDQVRSAILDHTEAAGSDEEIAAWYESAKGHLSFDRTSRRFTSTVPTLGK